VSFDSQAYQAHSYTTQENMHLWEDHSANRGIDLEDAEFLMPTPANDGTAYMGMDMATRSLGIDTFASYVRELSKLLPVVMHHRDHSAAAHRKLDLGK
jgi:hypothetical protein